MCLQVFTFFELERVFFQISLSAFPSKRLGMGCLHVIVETVSCRVHFTFIPASCGIFM